MGQLALAPAATSSNLALSMPGTSDLLTRWILVTVGPVGSISRVTMASVATEVAVWPALASSLAKAMVKQPAWAAAMSSSGLVPVPSSKRDWKLYWAFVEGLALGGDGALAGLEVAVPEGGCFAVHDVLLSS